MPRPIKPVTGGQTYAAASFECLATVDSRGLVRSVRVFFQDAKGNPIPDGAIPRAASITRAQEHAALKALSATVGTGTPSQVLLAAAAQYVALVYGLTLT
jgi:hypothetical protein